MVPEGIADLQTLPFLEWANLRTQLCWVYDDVVPASGRRRKRHEARMSAWLLREGTAEILSASGRRTVVRAGQWIFPPPDRRWQDFSAEAHLLSVNFEAKWPNGDTLFAPEEPVVVAASEVPRLTGAAEALALFVHGRFPEARTELRVALGSLEDHFEMQRLFATWLQVAAGVLLTRGVTPARLGKVDRRVLAAVRHLDTRPLHEAPSDAELVELTGLSVSQLNRLFGNEFGVSPKQYFERRRAEVARLSMRGADSTAKQVAYKLGFRSLSHFSVWFQKHEGCPPRRYRQLHARPAGGGRAGKGGD